MDAVTARVLVVDDEENIIFLLRSALRHFGFDVVVAADGRSALTTARANRPDLVVLDVMLPDIDGFEVCRRLRADGVDTPVLFLTARDSSDEAVRGLTLGGDDSVTKPFSLEEVIARVQALLRRAGDRTPASAKLALGDLEMERRRPRRPQGGRASRSTCLRRSTTCCASCSPTPDG